MAGLLSNLKFWSCCKYGEWRGDLWVDQSRHLTTRLFRKIFRSVSNREPQVYEYLVETAAGMQTRGLLQEFVNEIKTYKLTEAERSQSVNLRPATAVEIHLIVEDCDERLSSERVEALIETVDRILPKPPEKPEGEDVEEEAGEEEGGEEEAAEDVADGEPGVS